MLGASRAQMRTRGLGPNPRRTAEKKERGRKEEGFRTPPSLSFFPVGRRAMEFDANPPVIGCLSRSTSRRRPPATEVWSRGFLVLGFSSFLFRIDHERTHIVVVTALHISPPRASLFRFFFFFFRFFSLSPPVSLSLSLLPLFSFPFSPSGWIMEFSS